MKRHGTYNAEGAEQTRLEITFGCPAFLCLMGCVWTWRGMLLFLCALLLHEAGHAIVLRLVHVRVKAVRLGFGDVEMETARLLGRTAFRLGGAMRELPALSRALAHCACVRGGESAAGRL